MWHVAGYASKLIQYGWETVTEALKYGGVTNMMDRLSNPGKLKAFDLAEEMKDIMRPLYNKHQDDIMTGKFSATMKELLGWRADTAETAFEKTPAGDVEISEQEYFDNGILMVAMVKAGVELAFETMTAAGIIADSAYYESLHETPLIANTIARKKLFEMNSTISDTAEYGCYLYNHACVPLLGDFMKKINTDVIGAGLQLNDLGVDNARLIEVNEALRSHPVEAIGITLMPLPYSISLKNATVEFDKGFVCKNISWSVHPEHHWLICGSNGSGKSALAALLTGAGDVQDGIIKDLPERIGVVSFEAQQELIEAERRKDDADIMDVISEGTPVVEIINAVACNKPLADELCDKFGLTPLLDRAFRKLSTGESRKVMLIRALTSEPQLLILDEPFEGLDTASLEALQSHLNSIAATTTIVMVLNRLDQCMAAATGFTAFKNNRFRNTPDRY